jgi:hypothetical protein
MSDGQEEASAGGTSSERAATGTTSISISYFQTPRWYAARLAELTVHGSDATRAFGLAFEKAIDGDRDAFIGVSALHSLLESCEKAGMRLPRGTLRRLGESPHPSVRKSYVGYLLSIADDPRDALRVTFTVAEHDEDDGVRAAARTAFEQLLEDREERVAREVRSESLRASEFDDLDARIDAASVLRRDASDEARSRLEDLAANDRDPIVRAAAQHYLDVR